MAISLSPYLRRASENGGAIDVLGVQTGDAVEIADDTVSSAVGSLAGGLYRLAAISECTVRIGTGLSDATGGEYWPAGQVEVRSISVGQVVAVDAIS